MSYYIDITSKCSIEYEEAYDFNYVKIKSNEVIKTMKIKISGHHSWQITHEDIYKKRFISGLIGNQPRFEITITRSNNDHYNSENFEVEYNIPQNNIDSIILEYQPALQSESYDSDGHYDGHNQSFINIYNVRIYEKIDYSDSNLKIKLNNHIYSILSSQEVSPLKINTNTGAKNIKLIPADNSANSKLRIKTKNGTMAIAIKEI